MKDDLTMPEEPAGGSDSNELALWIGLTGRPFTGRVALDTRRTSLSIPPGDTERQYPGACSHTPYETFFGRRTRVSRRGGAGAHLRLEQGGTGRDCGRGPGWRRGRGQRHGQRLDGARGDPRCGTRGRGGGGGPGRGGRGGRLDHSARRPPRRSRGPIRGVRPRRGPLRG